MGLVVCKTSKQETIDFWCSNIYIAIAIANLKNTIYNFYVIVNTDVKKL